MQSLEDRGFEVMMADPPWPHGTHIRREINPEKRGKFSPDMPYDLIGNDEIQDILGTIKAPTLFLWAFERNLFEAQQVGEALGYKLHVRIVWDKLRGVAPCFTIRYQHEYLLWMYKPPMVKIAWNQRGKHGSVIRESSRKHSQKPEAAYELVEYLYPTQKKIELFARRARRGWAAWGNEIDEHGMEEL